MGYTVSSDCLLRLLVGGLPWCLESDEILDACMYGVLSCLDNDREPQREAHS